MFEVPKMPPGLFSNLFGLLGLATVCVAIALLTDYRWGMLSAGVFAVGLTVLGQMSQQQAAKDNVTPLKKAG